MTVKYRCNISGLKTFRVASVSLDPQQFMYQPIAMILESTISQELLGDWCIEKNILPLSIQY